MSEAQNYHAVVELRVVLYGTQRGEQVPVGEYVVHAENKESSNAKKPDAVIQEAVQMAARRSVAMAAGVANNEKARLRPERVRAGTVAEAALGAAKAVGDLAARMGTERPMEDGDTRVPDCGACGKPAAPGHLCTLL